MDDQQATGFAEVCPNCGGDLKLGELLYSSVPSPYPRTRCKAILDCLRCGCVFEQWAAEGAPIVPMDPEIRGLRERIRAKRELP